MSYFMAELFVFVCLFFTVQWQTVLYKEYQNLSTMWTNLLVNDLILFRVVLSESKLVHLSCAF